MRFSSSRMKERLGDPACTLPARRQGATRGTLQRWPACEMTTTSPGLRSEEREEHEELRRPSPRGRPRLGLLDPPGGDGQGRSKRQRPSLGKRVKVRKREGVQFYLENCTVNRVPAQCEGLITVKCLYPFHLFDPSPSRVTPIPSQGVTYPASLYLPFGLGVQLQSEFVTVGPPGYLVLSLFL